MVECLLIRIDESSNIFDKWQLITFFRSSRIQARYVCFSQCLVRMLICKSMKNSSLVLLFAMLLITVSCELKEEIDQVSQKSNAIEALAEYTMVSKQFNKASTASSNSVVLAEDTEMQAQLKNTSSQAKISVQPVGDSPWPILITVDFGNGITGVDGVTRKGKIHIESTDWYKSEGSIHVTSFEDYYQDDYKVEGFHIEENKGENIDGFLEFDVEIKNGQLIKPDGKMIEFTQHTSRTWIKGASTPLNILDDEYYIEGVQTGVSSKGVNYALQITSPLHLVLYPWQIKDGEMLVNVDGLNGIELNYATKKITIGGLSYPL